MVWQEKSHKKNGQDKKIKNVQPHFVTRKRPLVTIGPSGIACSKNKKETGGNNTPLQHSEWQEKEAHNSAQSSSSLSSSKYWSSQSNETVDEELNLCILFSKRTVQLQRQSPLQKPELPCGTVGIYCVSQFSQREYFMR